MIDFPVDIVYTWVDGSDSKWLKKKHDTLKKYSSFHKSENVSGNSRFLNRNELKFSLRSIQKYAPWVRKIFIVTDDQIPNWLNINNPKIQIIDHKEIFNDSSNLPTFNSNVIGAKLHHIKDLSNNFLYLNDDVFLGRVTKKSDFFDYNKKAKIFVGDKLKINKTNLLNEKSLLKNNVYQKGILNSRRLIFNKFNLIIPYVLRHGVICYNKTTNFQVEADFLEEFSKTLKHQFRDKNDFVFSTLVAYYLIAKDRIIPTQIKPYRKNYFRYKFNIFRINRDYVFIPLSSSKKNITSKIQAILKYNPLMFCINDVPNVSDEIYNIIDEFYINFLYEKSEFEL